MHAPRHQRRITIPYKDVDLMGRLPLSALFDFMQDLAGEHADLLGVGTAGLRKCNQSWVLSRMRIEAGRMLRAGEVVDLATWPRGIDRLLALRDFLLLDAGGRPVIAASTSWLLVDLGSMRPQRIDRAHPHLAGISGDLALGRDATRISPPEAVTAIDERRVRYSEIDINRHVNNAHYVAWVEDAVGGRLASGERLRAIEINYLNEARLGDRVRIGMAGGNGGTDLFEMVREEDGVRLALAVVEWAAGELLVKEERTGATSA